MIRTRHHVNHATVVAYLALFVALGGTSYAVVTVTGKNVKDGTLTGRDVKNSSLGTLDIKNGNLLAKDFKVGQLPAGPQGPQGPQGLKGDAGDKGDQGIQGVPGLSGLEKVLGAQLAMSTTAQRDAFVSCPAGKRPLSGGMETWVIGGGVPPVLSNVTLGTTDGSLTTVRAFKSDGLSWAFTPYAVCADVTP